MLAVPDESASVATSCFAGTDTRAVVCATTLDESAFEGFVVMLPTLAAQAKTGATDSRELSRFDVGLPCFASADVSECTFF